MAKTIEVQPITRKQLGGVTVNESDATLIPSRTGLDLGSATRPWRKVYVEEAIAVSESATFDTLTVTGTMTALRYVGRLTKALAFGSYLAASAASYNNSADVTVAVDATPLNTASKVVARDGSGNFAAGTITATLNGAAPAGSLSGTTLNDTVVTSSLTTIGTLVAGAVPASLVTAGTFGAGDYTFPANLAVTTALSVASSTVVKARLYNYQTNDFALTANWSGLISGGAQDDAAVASWAAIPQAGSDRFLFLRAPAGGAFKNRLNLGPTFAIFGDNTDGSHDVRITAAAGTSRDFSWYTASTNRWTARANATAEPGSDVGSDWQLISRTDAGSAKTVVLAFTRSSGTGTFGGNVVFASDNAFDFGASGATRPRTGYFGTSVVVGTSVGSFTGNVRSYGGTTAYDAVNPSGSSFVSTKIGASSQLNLRRANTGIGSETAVLSGETLGVVSSAGYTGSAYYTGAQINFLATENYASTTNGGTKIQFFTTLTGTQTLSAKWEMSSGGTLTPISDNTVPLAQSAVRISSAFVYTLDAKTTVGVGIGVTTAASGATVTVNAGTNAGANNQDAYYGVQRGGTALWRMGVLGSVSADANWTLRDVVNGSSAIVITPSTLAAVFGGSIKTATPSGGTAAAWKFGSRVAATVALDTTQYIELDVGGTLYKVGIVT